MTQKILRGALDFSWNEAAFAVLRGEDLILRENKMFSGHDASHLPEWLETAAAPAGGLAAVTEWTVGSGPGSFSGLRIASAFLMGLSYGRSGVRLRGISTAAAIAATAFPEGNRPERALVLFDGKRSEIIGCGVTLKNGSYLRDGSSGVCRTAMELRNLADGRPLCSLEKDSAAIAPFDAELVTAASIRADELIRNSPDDFSNPPTALEYLRAAVFVEPKTPRKIF